jgi:hypothetical protein
MKNYLVKNPTPTTDGILLSKWAMFMNYLNEKYKDKADNTLLIARTAKYVGEIDGLLRAVSMPPSGVDVFMSPQDAVVTMGITISPLREVTETKPDEHDIIEFSEYEDFSESLCSNSSDYVGTHLGRHVVWNQGMGSYTTYKHKRKIESYEVNLDILITKFNHKEITMGEFFKELMSIKKQYDEKTKTT